MPPCSAELGEEELIKVGGALLIGSKGKLYTKRAESAAAAEVAARLVWRAGEEIAAHSEPAPRVELGCGGAG